MITNNSANQIDVPCYGTTQTPNPGPEAEGNHSGRVVVSPFSSSSINCQLCNASLDLKIGQSSQREVVKTFCNPPHYFHLDCIASTFDRLLHQNRRCQTCNNQPFPLVRLSGVRPNETSPYCESLATHACRTGNLAELQKLMEQDPGMVVRPCHYPTMQSDTTLLSIAASFGQIECLKALINCGPKEQLELDQALVCAIKSSHTDCVRLLLNEGATNVNQAMLLASDFGHTECLEVLLDNGANEFAGALSFSAGAGHIECMKVLFNRVKTFTTNNLNECLRSAASFNFVETLQPLIDNGANDLDGALVNAALHGHRESLRILLLKGANSSMDALCGTIMSDSTECLKLLLDNGASELYTPLAYAKQLNRIECQRILRERIYSQQMSCTIL